jgi:predicted transposase YbfD/YdcC
VSAFTHQQGRVLHLQVSENKYISEIEVVRQIITALAGQPIVFTLDALHCQKKTVELIVDQQQHYLIALNANQPTLYQTLVALHPAGNPLTVAETVDSSHNRTVHRRVSVYAAPPNVQPQWAGLKTLIWVERWAVREQKPFQEQVGSISDLALTAAEFLPHIQQHWSIENQLHWVRDVTFEEDYARPGGHAPVMWAILGVAE